MKNLIILGVPRAGKSTLAHLCARQLAKDGIPVALMSADAIIGGLTAQRNGFLWHTFIRPIRHLFPFIRRKSKQKLQSGMRRFIQRFFDETSQEIPIIFEGTYISPNMAAEIFDMNKCKIVVVGYPNINPDVKIADIRKFDKGSPISGLNDNAIKQRVKSHILTSRQFMEQSKNRFVFLDTSNDYHGTLGEFAKNVTKFLAE